MPFPEAPEDMKAALVNKSREDKVAEIMHAIKHAVSAHETRRIQTSMVEHLGTSSTSEPSLEQTFWSLIALAIELDVGDEVMQASESYQQQMQGTSTPEYIPPGLQRLKCANYDVKEARICPNDARQACANCRLVSYCGKRCVTLGFFVFAVHNLIEFVSCQTMHWKMHKRGASLVAFRSPPVVSEALHRLSRQASRQGLAP